MLGFLVDEDLPRSLVSVLVEAGFQAHDVRDVGLRGKSDAEVFAEQYLLTLQFLRSYQPFQMETNVCY